MSDLTATRDLVVIAAIAYIAYKLKSPLAGMKESAGDVYVYLSDAVGTKIEDVRQYKEEFDAGQTQTEVTQDYTDYWNKYFQDRLGKFAPTVPTPPTAADPVTGEGMQETVQILPHLPSKTTPELTQDIIDMIEAPAPDRPNVQIFPIHEPAPPQAAPGRVDIMPITPPQPRQPTYRAIQPIVQPIVPSVTELVRQPSPPARQPITETKPLSSMSREQATSEGYKYSGAVGWYK